MAVWFGGLIALTCIANIVLSLISVNTIIQNREEKALTNSAIQSSQLISLHVEYSKETLTSLARNMQQYGFTTVQECIDFMSKELQYTDFTDLAYVDLQGNSRSVRGETMNIAGSPSFEQALMGEANLVGPMHNGNDMVMLYSVPTYYNDRIVGVIVGTQTRQYFVETIGDIGSEYFIIDAHGRLVASTNEEDYEKTNIKPEEKKSPEEFREEGIPEVTLDEEQLGDIAEVYQKMMSGESGFQMCNVGDMEEKVYLSYSPVQSTNWSMATLSDYSETQKALMSVSLFLIVSISCMIIISVFFAYKVGEKIAERVNLLSKELNILEKGKLNAHLNSKLFKYNDEISDAARDILSVQKQVGRVIGHIQATTEQMNAEVDHLNQA